MGEGQSTLHQRQQKGHRGGVTGSWCVLETKGITVPMRNFAPLFQGSERGWMGCVCANLRARSGA